MPKLPEESKSPQRSKTVWVGALEAVAGAGELLVGVVDEPLVGIVLLASGVAKVVLRFLTKGPVEI